MTNSCTANHSRNILRKLGFSPHQFGYKVLIPAIHLYSQDNVASLTKEIYPTLAKQYHANSPCAIERAIRYAIATAWQQGSPEEWQRLFPRATRPPSNMVFISVIAEYQK